MAKNFVHKDLSHFHHTVSNIFSQPQSIEEWSQLKLPDSDVEFYAENGYLANVPMITETQIDELRTQLDELMLSDHSCRQLFYEVHDNESLDADKVLFHALGAWRISSGFHDCLWNPRFVVAASQLLGSIGTGVRFWHDQLFVKPAEVGGVVAWHQDYSYWTRTIPMNHLTCWCALDDANRDNGCLQYVPKSHKWGLLPKPPALAGTLCDPLDSLTPQQRQEEFHPIFLETKAGEACFHHPLLLHASGENITGGTSRRAFVLNVFADGTISDTDQELLSGVPIVPKGCKIEGQFFPLLSCPML